MDFPDTVISLPAGGRTIRVIVTGDALHCWWGGGVGPQDVDGLIERYMHQIEDIVGDKIIAGQVEDDGSVIVNSMDVEG